MKKLFLHSVVVFSALIVFSALSALAQDESVDDVINTVLVEVEPDAEPVVQDKDVSVKPEDIPSLFFTYWQYQAILDAKNSRGAVKPLTREEEDALARGEVYEPEPETRNIVLGGIVYNSSDDWTIWLNEQRVTPNAIPKQVFDLKVYKDYIEMRWLDDYTNQIFPLRMRAHQRFNLDARIFLMGE